MTVKTMRFGADMPSIIREIFTQFNGTAPGICEAMDILRVSLAKIAQRAIEINDAPILEELEVLGCIHPTKERKP